MIPEERSTRKGAMTGKNNCMHVDKCVNMDMYKYNQIKFVGLSKQNHIKRAGSKIFGK